MIFFWGILKPSKENNSDKNLTSENVGITKGNMINSRNIILYGPPGTGKTYNTIDKALQIIDEQFYNDNKHNRKGNVKKSV